ncbi:MAG: cupin domain-containing protein [Dehalococcoidia bacterium]|nr:cupin domain-containing protein [Dehalococcoidia bacterium]
MERDRVATTRPRKAATGAMLGLPNMRRRMPRGTLARNQKQLATVIRAAQPGRTMDGSTRTRIREPEPTIGDPYDEVLKYLYELRARSFQRAVVLRGDEAPWEESSMGRLKFFINRETDDTNTVLRDWNVFLQDIDVDSGSHKHQGGLAIYVVEGEGWTDVDGERIEWEAGDLLVFPIRAGGVPHQHYNKHPGERCVWMTLIFSPYMDEVGKWVDEGREPGDGHGSDEDRQREIEPSSTYRATLEYLRDLRRRSFERQVLLRGEERPWGKSRQGFLKRFINRETDLTNSVLRDWSVFQQDIRNHSGAHRHQGGLGIYVVEGEGWTDVDGERVDWEAGDLILLPIKPGGVLHQHHNRHPGQNCTWMAFIYSPYMDEVGKWVEQKAVSPDFQQHP